MSEKFTPGPWSYLAGTTTCEKVLGADGKVVADGWWCRSVEEVDANSRLIAAAPDLLNVSEHAIQWLQGDKWRFDEDPTKRESWEIMMRALKNAVAKARGES